MNGLTVDLKADNAIHGEDAIANFDSLKWIHYFLANGLDNRFDEQSGGFTIDRQVPKRGRGSHVLLLGNKAPKRDVMGAPGFQDGDVAQACGRNQAHQMHPGFWIHLLESSAVGLG